MHSKNIFYSHSFFTYHLLYLISYLIIGGGFIGTELGSHFKKLGCDVTIIEFLDRILPMMDKELSAGILGILKL